MAPSLPQSDFDRLAFFHLIRQSAEERYASDPTDADNLTRWGGALLEISQFHLGSECLTIAKEAITRLEEAVKVDPKKHNALWCLGNAHNSCAFLSTEEEMAKLYFTKASEYFQKAINEDPGNELYLKSLEVTIKFSQAPDFQLELQRQAASEAGTSGGSSFSKTIVSKGNQGSGLMYDLCGWIILAVGLIAWIRMLKSQPHS